MDFKLEIISGMSAAGIQIGENINGYLSDIYGGKYKVELKKYNNQTGIFYSYIINSGLITINTLECGKIISITCNQDYKGKYKNVIHTGINIEFIRKNTRTHLIMNGGLVIDDDFGLYFVLPSPYDEIADTISCLPRELVLNFLHVENVVWWIKPELTPDYAK